MSSNWFVQRIAEGLAFGLAASVILRRLLGDWGIQGTLAYLLIPFVCVSYVAWKQKQLYLRAMPPDVMHSPTSPDCYPSIDRAALDEMTSELRSLGFVELADLETRGTIPPVVGFDRIFLHPVHGCYAAICQMQTPLFPMWCDVVSTFRDGYTYATRKEDLPQRQPKSFWSSHPYASPTELFRAHIETRDRLICQSELQIDRIETVQDYSLRVKQGVSDYRSWMSSRWSICVLLDFIVYKVGRRSEWLGSAWGSPP